jgi:hypothetical protein
VLLSKAELVVSEAAAAAGQDCWLSVQLRCSCEVCCDTFGVLIGRCTLIEEFAPRAPAFCLPSQVKWLHSTSGYTVRSSPQGSCYQEGMGAGLSSRVGKVRGLPVLASFCRGACPHSLFDSGRGRQKSGFAPGALVMHRIASAQLHVIFVCICLLHMILKSNVV